MIIYSFWFFFLLYIKHFSNSWQKNPALFTFANCCRTCNSSSIIFFLFLMQTITSFPRFFVFLILSWNLYSYNPLLLQFRLITFVLVSNCLNSGLPLRVILLVPDVFSAGWERIACLLTSFARLETERIFGFLLVELIAYQSQNILLVTLGSSYLSLTSSFRFYMNAT